MLGGALGTGLAMVAGSIVDVLIVFYTLLTVSLFVPVMAGLYLRRLGTPEALASIVAGGAPVRLDHRFNEIDFGRWEGLTKEEIEASDPMPYADWQAKAEDFEFPGGEARSAFSARVESWQCFV